MKIFGTALMLSAFNILLTIGVWWIVASGVVSGVKIATSNCGQAWIVDQYYIQSNFFCDYAPAIRELGK